REWRPQRQPIDDDATLRPLPGSARASTCLGNDPSTFGSIWALCDKLIARRVGFTGAGMVRAALIDRARKLLAATASALLLVIALAHLLPTSAATGDWPKERFDPGNTSYNPNETVI